MKIKDINAMEILDSRGNPTLQVTIYSEKHKATASVPSGASTGKHEALELRPISKCIANVAKLKKKLIGIDVRKQEEIDKLMIKLAGKNKKKLGANTVLGISMAVCRLASIELGIELYEYIGTLYGNSEYKIPLCCFNVINGGRHASNKLAIQEFMIVPHYKSFTKNYFTAAKTYQALKKIQKNKQVGDEGGFAPDINTAEQALNMLNKVCKGNIKYAIDAAASEFFHKGKYKLHKTMTSDQLLEYYIKLVKKYPIFSIEDPFNEDDFKSFADLNKLKLQVVGDDLTVTNVSRIKKAIEMNSCNCLLLKLNQIGSITEALEAAKLVKLNGWKIMVSHRSGETTDTFISDLSVGIGAEYMKSGAPARGERVCKYNRLLEIEKKL